MKCDEGYECRGQWVGEGTAYDADDHLVQEGPEGPPVHGEAVPLVEQHLGGQVLAGPPRRRGRRAERRMLLEGIRAGVRAR